MEIYPINGWKVKKRGRRLELRKSFPAGRYKQTSNVLIVLTEYTNVLSMNGPVQLDKLDLYSMIDAIDTARKEWSNIFK